MRDKRKEEKKNSCVRRPPGFACFGFLGRVGFASSKPRRRLVPIVNTSRPCAGRISRLGETNVTLAEKLASLFTFFFSRPFISFSVPFVVAAVKIFTLCFTRRRVLCAVNFVLRHPARGRFGYEERARALRELRAQRSVCVASSNTMEDKLSAAYIICHTLRFPVHCFSASRAEASAAGSNCRHSTSTFPFWCRSVCEGDKNTTEDRESLGAVSFLSFPPRFLDSRRSVAPSRNLLGYLNFTRSRRSSWGFLGEGLHIFAVFSFVGFIAHAALPGCASALHCRCFDAELFFSFLRFYLPYIGFRVGVSYLVPHCGWHLGAQSLASYTHAYMYV